MKFSTEKALQICGNNNMYQKLLFVFVSFTWFAVDFVSITFPLLEMNPTFKCQRQSTFTDCSLKEACLLPSVNVKVKIPSRSIVIDFKLWCNKLEIILIGVVYTVGIFLGALLFSKLLDVMGRKYSLILANCIFAINMFLLTIAPNVTLLYISLFFIGIACSGGTLVSFVFINEVVAPNRRSFYSTLINSAFALAGIVYFAIYQAFGDWKTIAYISCIADIIAGIVVFLFFVESPRYLYTKGKTEKCIMSLYKIARFNRKTEDLYKFLLSELNMDTSDEINTCNSEKILSNCSPHETVNKTEKPQKLSRKEKLNKIKELIKDMKQSSAENTEPLIEHEEMNMKDKEKGYLDLCRYKSIRSTFLITCGIWFITSFVYYGISLSLKNFSGNIFFNGYIVYTAELASYFITGFLVNWSLLGRTKTLNIMLCVAGIACFLYDIVTIAPYQEIFLFCARFGITAIYTTMYIYSCEVFPTSIRGKGLGINTLFARLGTILVPIIVDLINPLILFCVLCLVCMLMTFFIPETLNKELEDDLEEDKEPNKQYTE